MVCALASRMLATPGAGPITSYRIGGAQISYGRDGAETVGLTQAGQTALTCYRLVGITAAR